MDIVARLKALIPYWPTHEAECRDAIAEIERLTRAEIGYKAKIELQEIEVDRLRHDINHRVQELEEMAKAIDETARERDAVRAALRSVDCPAGGWTGMPAGLDAKVGDCIDHGVCGCSFGDALKSSDVVSYRDDPRSSEQIVREDRDAWDRADETLRKETGDEA